MSITAKGSGYIVLNDNITKEEKDYLKNLFDSADIEYDDYDSKNWEIWYYGKYYDEDMKEALGAACKLSSDISMEFSSDENDFWKFYSKNGKALKNVSGRICYDDENIILDKKLLDFNNINKLADFLKKNLGQQELELMHDALKRIYELEAVRGFANKR